MDMIAQKKGVGMSSVGKYIGIFIGVIVLFLVVAELLPEAETAGNAINATGAPLGSLFASGGALFVIIMAGLLLFVVGYFWHKAK